MSKQRTDLEMVQAAAALAWSVWRQTDFDEVSASRSLDDEFASRIATAAHTGSVAGFLDNLTSKWGVRSFDDRDTDIREIVAEYDEEASKSVQRRFLSTIRNNSALIVLEMKDEYQNDDS